MEGRCMKCKKQVEIKDGVETATKNGRQMLKGKCPVCGTTVCRFMGKVKTQKINSKKGKEEVKKMARVPKTKDAQPSKKEKERI